MVWLCCVRQQENVKVLDYRHSGLSKIPSAVVGSERTLEELYLDSNQLKSLPRELFGCNNLRKLTLSDNDVTLLPSTVGNLSRLEELDISKNGILELPEDIKGCKNLQAFEASVNPLGRLPDGFTQLLNLTSVYLNDAFLEYLPGSFGRLSRLKILELRENHLKTLPMSLGRLTELERLDIGNNELTELPDVIGSLTSLLELWCDSNQIVKLPDAVGNLKQLMYLDASKNRISSVGDRIDGCTSLSDLHLSMNLLQQLPQSIGRLSNLTSLKVNDNRLTSLPSSIGGLAALSELDVTANDLEELPPTIGLLRHLRTLIADENFLVDIPPELGSCSALTVLSARSNKLTYLPDEIGRVYRLRVLNVSDNELKCLPSSLVNLRELQALWLAENQAKPLIRLQPDTDSLTGKRSLTCYLLPQQRTDAKTYAADDETSFRASVWDEQRQLRQQIRFDSFPENGEKLPTSYPKERATAGRHEQNLAVLKKSSNGTVSGIDAHTEGVVSANAADDLPRTTPHRLLKLEKERLAKERARINSRRSSGGGTDDELHGGSAPAAATMTATAADRASESASKMQDRGSEQNVMSASHVSLTKAARVDNGHHTGEHQAGVFRSASGSLAATGGVAGNSTRSFLLPARDKDSSRGDGTTSAEDHFGVFLSEENPELYQQRFQYYKRVRQSRKSGEAASDLGYYGHGRENGGANGRHHHRPPLMAGLDGSSSEWDAQTNRSTGDGYASDLDGYNGRRRQGRHHARSSQHSHYHHQLVSTAEVDDEGTVQHGVAVGRPERAAGDRLQPDVPPATTASGRRPLPSARSSGGRSGIGGAASSPAARNASRPQKAPIQYGPLSAASPADGTLQPRDYASIAKELEGSSFPPPPPYKPPTRDLHPDGASNEGDLGKSHASLEGGSSHGGSSTIGGSVADHHVTKTSSAYGGSTQGLSATVAAAAAGRLPVPTTNRVQSASAGSDYSVLPSAGAAGGPLAPPRAEQRGMWPDFVVSSTPCLEPFDAAGSGGPASAVLLPPPSDGWPSPVRAGPERWTPMPACPKAAAALAAPARAGTDHRCNGRLRSVPNAPAPPSAARSLAFHDNRTFYDELTTWRPTQASGGPTGSVMAAGIASASGQVPPAAQQQPWFVGPDRGGGAANGCSLSHSNGWAHSPVDSAFSSPRARLTMASAASPVLLMGGRETTSHSPYIPNATDPGCSRGTTSDTTTRLPAPGASDSQAARLQTTVPTAVVRLHPQQTMTTPDRSSMTKPQPEPYSNGRNSNGYRGHSPPTNVDILTFSIALAKNAELGFSIAGGIGSQGNPFRLLDKGIFVSKVSTFGPAANVLQPGDKILEVNGVDLSETEHHQAVSLLKSVSQSLTITVERMQPTTV